MDTKTGLPEKLRNLDVDEKKELIGTIGQTACDNERIYHGCARSTLNALQVHLGLEPEAVSALVKAAALIGGGVAQTGESCGALLAGLMAIGLVYETGKMEDSRTCPAHQEALSHGITFSDRFKSEFGALRCHDVQKGLFGRYYDLRNPEDSAKFRESDHTKCEDVVCRRVSQLAAEVILEL